MSLLSIFCPPGRPRGFKLRLPLLRSLSNSKVSLNDPEAGQIPTATPLHPDHHSHESLGLGEFLPLPPLPLDHQEHISGSRWGLWIIMRTVLGHSDELAEAYFKYWSCGTFLALMNDPYRPSEHGTIVEFLPKKLIFVWLWFFLLRDF